MKYLRKNALFKDGFSLNRPLIFRKNKAFRGIGVFFDFCQNF